MDQIELALDGELQDALHLVAGEAYHLTWTPRDPSARVRLTLRSQNVSHGMPLQRIIECDTADVGQLEIPREIVDLFPIMEGTDWCAGFDCPRSSFERYRRAAQSVSGGEVELVVTSELEFLVVKVD